MIGHYLSCCPTCSLTNMASPEPGIFPARAKINNSFNVSSCYSRCNSITLRYSAAVQRRRDNVLIKLRTASQVSQSLWANQLIRPTEGVVNSVSEIQVCVNANSHGECIPHATLVVTLCRVIFQQTYHIHKAQTSK